ncbi:MAG TPA: calcium/proton exchanger [Ktedonobacterales bacterium]
MPKWLLIFLLGIPGLVLAEVLHAAPLLVFTLAALALIPLAGLIGESTEVLAERVGPTAGGLLNATFGNAAELIIGIAALLAGLQDVVLASITGSIIGNVLLVQGGATLAGGWKHGMQRFSARNAGNYATIMALSVVGLAIPTLTSELGFTRNPAKDPISGGRLDSLSVIIACILLVSYVGYVAFSVFGVRASRRLPSGHEEIGETPLHRIERAEADESARQMLAERKADTGIPQPGLAGFVAAWRLLWRHTLWLPVATLALATAATAFASEALVGTIGPVADSAHLNKFFVGLIIIPVVGNAAEHFTAVTMALRDDMETSLAITAGSSVQVALLVAPLLVIIGAVTGHPLDLQFSLLELVILGMVAALFALVSLDGRATWIEGLQLLAFYLIVAVSVFFLPV